MPAATAAADPPDDPPGTRVFVARIAHRMERRILGRRAHGELVAVKLAQHDGARRLQARHGSAVVRRNKIFQNLRCRGSPHAARHHHIFDRDRNAGERRQRLSLAAILSMRSACAMARSSESVRNAPISHLPPYACIALFDDGEQQSCAVPRSLCGLRQWSLHSASPLAVTQSSARTLFSAPPLLDFLRGQKCPVARLSLNHLRHYKKCSVRLGRVLIASSCGRRRSQSFFHIFAHGICKALAALPRLVDAIAVGDLRHRLDVFGIQFAETVHIFKNGIKSRSIRARSSGVKSRFARSAT